MTSSNTFDDILIQIIVETKDIKFYKVFESSKTWRLKTKYCEDFVDLEHKHLISLYKILKLYFGDGQEKE